MTWSGADIAELVACRRHRELSAGDRAQRLEAERWQPAVPDRFADEVDDGSVPLAVLDALLTGDDLRGYVAAGPLEDLLHRHAASYGSAITERARQDPRWAAALGGARRRVARRARPPGAATGPGTLAARERGCAQVQLTSTAADL